MSKYKMMWKDKVHISKECFWSIDPWDGIMRAKEPGNSTLLKICTVALRLLLNVPNQIKTISLKVELSLFNKPYKPD